MNFNSRIDLYGWVSLIIEILVLALPCFVFTFSWIYFVIMLILDIAIIVFKFTTRYELGEKELVVRSGPVKYLVTYERILQIKKTKSFWSLSSSTAIKCIEIKFGDSLESCQTINLSPQKEDEFLALLALKCKNITEVNG